MSGGGLGVAGWVVPPADQNAVSSCLVPRQGARQKVPASLVRRGCASGATENTAGQDAGPPCAAGGRRWRLVFGLEAGQQHGRGLLQ